MPPTPTRPPPQGDDVEAEALVRDDLCRQARLVKWEDSKPVMCVFDRLSTPTLRLMFLDPEHLRLKIPSSVRLPPLQMPQPEYPMPETEAPDSSP